MKKMLRIPAVTAAALIALLFTVTLFGKAEPVGNSASRADAYLASSDSDGMTYVFKKGEECSYSIVVAASDVLSADVDIATEISSLIAERGAEIYWNLDVSSTPSERELLLGGTNRPISERAQLAVDDARYGDMLVWCIIEENGQVAYTANSDEAFRRGKRDLLSYLTEDAFAVPKGINMIFTMTREEYESEMETEKEMQRLERIEELKKLIGNFGVSDFGSVPDISMAGSKFGSPNLYPTEGDHPRLNVTSHMLPDIKKYMESDEAKYTSFYFWKLANTAYDGKLPEATYHPDGNRIGMFNMDEEGLAIIEAKAFAYLLTGDELYAYEAILAMKNYLTTIDIQYIHSDQCREFGRIIYCTAIVYDWCHPLLSEDDKTQFRMAVADIGSSKNQNTDFGNQMEVGFPPHLGTVVSSHSSEHQVLRDYLSIAIAVFDEDPTWYEWVAGMIYNYYVPFREYYFQSGTYPQGVNIYAPHRFDADLWSVWMLYCSVGEIPYGDYFKSITHSFFNNECPDGSLFSTGDGRRVSSAVDFWHHALISSALYGDEALRTAAKKLSDSFTGYDGSSLKFSFTEMLILSGSYYSKTESEGAEDHHDGNEPVSYFDSPLGQLIVRERWSDENVAAVFMRIGERTTANHEHEDAGTFQIFYKGLYSGDSGEYSGYASPHWYYYSTATVAHNGLLISNPAKIGDNPALPASYFYSGGQRKMSEASTLDSWLKNSGYETGSVIGREWSYKEDGSTDIAYIGGEITKAYEASDVAYVGRHMLTYYTGNPEAPMYLMVYDKITSTDESFKKIFLLHTTNEPEIDNETRTVISTENGGRLVLKSLLGGDCIEAIGGEGKDYYINGRQCETGLEGVGMKEWGRVEISPAPNAMTHHLLNFMYVTDSDSELMLSPTLIETENARGLVIDSSVFLFADAEGERNSKLIEFEITGKGLYRIVVTGMYSGTWDVTVDGVTVAHAVSSADGGLISFYAPQGKVNIVPGRDIVPSNGGRIIYNSFGGAVPDDAPLVYEIGVPIALPENVDNGCNTFVGWYTSPDFSEDARITEIVATEKGNFNVYAKYAGILINEKFEDYPISMSSGALNGIVYNGKTGSFFETRANEKTGNTYLHITKGTSDPNVDVAISPVPYMYGGKKLTLSIDLARESSSVIEGICRIRGMNGSNDTFPYFTTTQSGLVLLGGSLAVMDLTSQFQTLGITLDFERGTATAYDKDGYVLGTVSFTPPAASLCDSNEAWLNSITSAVNWWMGGGETLLIDNFTVYAGDFVPRPIVIPEGYSQIEYNPNGGLFLSSPAPYYKEGEITLLEPNITKGDDEFLGWYTTPDFKKGTRIAEISPETTGTVTVYAKWAGKVLNVDFEGKDVHFEKEVGYVGTLEYNGTTSTGAYFKTEVDASGNTYAVWHRGSGDPQVKYNGKFTSFPGRHVVTYSIDLATVSSETPLEFDFCVRSTKPMTASNAANRFALFHVDTEGNVKLGGTTLIATLSSQYFTTIVVTVDFELGTVTAYNPADASPIASTAVVFDDYLDWLDAMNLPLYVYAGKGESIKMDNVSIVCAPYTVGETDDEVSSSIGKIDYILNGGSFESSVPTQYKKGESVKLPTPVRANSVFLGWYMDSKLTQPIAEITPEDTENFILYAKWQAKVFELSPDTYPDLNVLGKVNGAGANNQIGDVNFQTQGYNGCYVTETGDNGEKYILWKKGTRDPQLIYGGNLATKAGGNLVISFSITMSKHEDGNFMELVARMRTPKINGARRELHLFTLSADGSVHISSDKTQLIGCFGEEFKTLGVVADFANEKLYGYDENGDLVAECAMKIPSAYSDGVEFYNDINEDILGFYAGGTAETAVRIGSIVIETGNIFEK